MYRIRLGVFFLLPIPELIGLLFLLLRALQCRVLSIVRKLPIFGSVIHSFFFDVTNVDVFFYICKSFLYFNIILTHSAADDGSRSSSVVELTTARRQSDETDLSETKSPQGFIFVAVRASSRI